MYFVYDIIINKNAFLSFLPCNKYHDLAVLSFNEIVV